MIQLRGRRPPYLPLRRRQRPCDRESWAVSNQKPPPPLPRPLFLLPLLLLLLPLRLLMFLARLLLLLFLLQLLLLRVR